MTADEVLQRFPSPSLRPYQKEIIVRIVEAFQTGKKCVILAAPTGFGKSYVNAAFTSVTHSFYATPQLALLDQIKNDPYLEGRFVEVSGRQNYQCYYQPNRRVNVGKCESEDYACKERYEVCPYWIQKMRARNAPSVLTTLAYLISEGQTEDRSDSYLGNRKLLVLDEAHNLEDQCLNHISLRLGPFTLPHEIYEEVQPELERLESDAQVKELVGTVSERLENLLEKSKIIAETSGLSIAQVEDRNRTEQFLASYELYKNSRSEWIWQVRNDQLLLQPVFGREFVRQLVWKRAEHYIISSATILDSHEFAELTGILDFLTEDQVTSLSLPSTFPVANRPVINAMVGPLSRQEWETNMPKAVHMVEEILRKELGNVAIHCHSYQHQRYLAENLSNEFAERLIVHSSRDREEKLDVWMHSRGKVFVSVAFNEGQDWKYDVCDAQILLKVPFPNLGDKRVKRRLDLGHRKWYENQAMLEVIQAYGRAIRAEDDSARFYIVDGSFTRLLKSRWDSIPDWFKEALPDNAR
ncbi:MAG: ATP-dependent DNA helicase [Candidatus Bathyarchaeia archaeon]